MRMWFYIHHIEIRVNIIWGWDGMQYSKNQQFYFSGSEIRLETSLDLKLAYILKSKRLQAFLIQGKL